MDFQSYNRTTLNKARIDKIDSKVMVFVLPRVVQTGMESTILRFPFKGEIKEVYANCTSPSNKDAVFKIEKSSQEDYDSTSLVDGGGVSEEGYLESTLTINPWKPILSDNLVIDAKHKSSRTSKTPYSIGIKEVEKGDHFLITVLEGGEGLQDVTVEIEVELDTEF